ncbi:hypothetical protein LINPERHAP2_LOCUS24804 [Linum perenne]
MRSATSSLTTLSLTWASKGILSHGPMGNKGIMRSSKD